MNNKNQEIYSVELDIEIFRDTLKEYFLSQDPALAAELCTLFAVDLLYFLDMDQMDAEDKAKLIERVTKNVGNMIALYKLEKSGSKDTTSMVNIKSKIKYGDE